jgi:hypothetical protein
LDLILAGAVVGGRQDLWLPDFLAHLQRNQHADRLVSSRLVSSRLVLLGRSTASIRPSPTFSRVTPSVPSRRSSTSIPAVVTVIRCTRS